MAHIRGPDIQPLGDHPSLQERTYRTLRDAIIDGRFAPGERLYETTVAESLGVSRNPVREAVRRLQQDGFLIVRPRTGIFVAEHTTEEARDLYRLRAALEGTAAALAAERMTDADLDSLARVLERMESASDRRASSAMVREADLFHRAIHEGARSPRVLALVNQVYGQIAFYRNVTLRVPGRPRSASHAHREVLDALRERDAERAESLIRRHVMDAADVLLKTWPDRTRHAASSPDDRAGRSAQ